MRVLRVTATARRDVDAIAQWTEQRWGRDQALSYVGRIKAAFQTIRTNPEIGKERFDLSPGFQAFAVAQHVVFYQLIGERVEVIRVLHRRMLPGRYVAADDP